MNLTTDEVLRIAKLARIDVSGDDLMTLGNELSGVFSWIEQMDKIDVSGVVPFPEINTQILFERQDVVQDENLVDALLKNAPDASFSMFSVAKVIE